MGPKFGPSSLPAYSGVDVRISEASTAPAPRPTFRLTKPIHRLSKPLAHLIFVLFCVGVAFITIDHADPHQRSSAQSSPVGHRRGKSGHDGRGGLDGLSCRFWASDRRFLSPTDCRGSVAPRALAGCCLCHLHDAAPLDPRLESPA